MGKDLVIFGAGQIGRMALEYYGDRVAFFIDNDDRLYGKEIAGKKIEPVISVKETNYRIVIASKQWKSMKEQLDSLGFSNYEIYLKNKKFSYYETDNLIFNPYLDNDKRNISENEWINNNQRNFARKEIDAMVESFYNRNILFDHVEIETINRCNGTCDFCPVSKQRDIRKFQIMSKDLFEKIIGQLSDIKYSGKLALFSNNEPFLDPDIIKRHKYAREKLPEARMHLFTNGTLLNLHSFVEIIEYLDELVIDNYHQDLKLIKPCKDIVEYCERNPELKRKVTVVLRKPHEILTNRGGDAPNRKVLVSYKKDRCILPFKQLIIRPDGKVSLCCNDPLGKNTMGDINKNSILEIWNGNEFRNVRDALYKGRENWSHCKFCDVFSLG